MHRLSLPRFLSTTLKGSLCALLLSGCGAIVRKSSVPGDETFPTDLEFVQSIASDSFREVLGEMPLEKASRVVVVGQPSQKNDWIVRDALARTLLEEGYALVQAEQDSISDPEEVAYTLSFRVIGLRLECQYGGSRFWGHRTFMRRGLIDLALRLTDARDGAVVWAKQRAGRGEDRVPAAYSRTLEAPDAVPREMIEKESHWLEGIVVVGIIGSLVYLSL